VRNGDILGQHRGMQKVTKEKKKMGENKNAYLFLHDSAINPPNNSNS